MVRLLLLNICLLLGAVGSLSHADTTKLDVLVRAGDSKFIGTGVGGMHVTVKDVKSGRLLANGKISGETGDTQALMTKGQKRGHSPVTKGTARFSAQFDLERPSRVEVSVTGPQDVAQSAQTVTTTLWMIPGRHLTDPGLIMHMPGLIVDLIESAQKNNQLALTATVTMMCGCPITEKGLWKSEDFTVMAQLIQEGSRIGETALTFTGKDNTFSGAFETPPAGEYELIVYGVQESAGNAGVFEKNLQIK